MFSFLLLCLYIVLLILNNAILKLSVSKFTTSFHVSITICIGGRKDFGNKVLQYKIQLYECIGVSLL